MSYSENAMAATFINDKFTAAEDISLNDLREAEGTNGAEFKYDRFDPEAMLNEVRRRFAYVKEMDHVADLDDFIIRGMDGFAAYASKYNAWERDQTGKWHKVVTATRWRESPDRIELVRPVYEPGLVYPTCEIDGNKYFNLWRGFAAAPREGDVSPLLTVVDHLFEKMPEECEHFLKFHAYARQHPGEKPMHAEMLISRAQGIGKSLVGEIIGYGLWGERNFSEVEHGHLDAAFNNFLKHKKFILANEMLLSSLNATDKRRDANRIKNAITRDRVEVNEKYIKQYFTRDVLYWMLTSNFDDAVWLDREDDRRFHIARLKQATPLSQQYGDDFGAKAKAWAKSPEGAAAINYYFLHYPIGNFSGKTAPPITEGQRITHEMGLSTLEKFIRELIDDRGQFNGRDLVQLNDIRVAFSTEYPESLKVLISDQAIAAAISRFGGSYMPQKVHWTDRERLKAREARVWAIRNAQYWLTATNAARSEHYVSPTEHPGPKAEMPRENEEVI